MKKNILLVILCLCAPLNGAEPLNPLTSLKDPNYARGIYFTDQSLLTDLLQNVNRSNNNARRYVHAVLKTFTNVVKGSDCVTTDSFIKTLQFLAESLPFYLQSRDYESYTQQIIERDLEAYQRLQGFNQAILLNTFNQNYEDFQLNPIQFLQNIADIVTQAAQEELEIQKLRNTLKIFLELHLNKLIWAYEENEGCWEQVKTIAALLTSLFENNVFDDLNDLDDLFWSLIHRFGHFFEYTYKHCSYSLFDAIKHDLAHGSLLLLDLAEQDACIIKRSECLLHTVMHAEARRRAHDISNAQPHN